MSAESAQARLVPALERAYEAVFTSTHGAPDPGCDACVRLVEGAALAVFREWERFLFDLLVDLMAGYQTIGHHAHFCVPRQQHASRGIARAQLLRSRVTSGTVKMWRAPRDFLLLHAISPAITIADHWLIDSPVAAVLATNSADIARAIRIR